MKPSEKRPEKIHEFIGSYQNAVSWLRTHKGKLLFIVLVTFLQRCSVFLLTYMVYLGFGLHGTGMMKVILLQAAVYIAVDMLSLIHILIVDGAVGMVEMALDRLSEKKVVELDEERKAAMVSNLLVVLCGNKDAQPIVNSGSLY